MNIEQAYDLFDEGDYLTSQAVCDALLASDKDYFPAIYLLGAINSQFGDNQTAIHFYERGLQLRPDAQAVLFNLAFIYLKVSNVRRAFENICRFIELNSNDPEAYVLSSTIRMEMADLSGALKDIELALKLAPDSADAFNNRGSCLYQLGQLEESKSALDQAILLSPDHVKAHTNLGLVLSEMGLFEAAICAHERAILLMPDFAEAHTNLGLAFNAAGRSEDAIAAHKHAILLNADYAEAYTNLGVVLNEVERNEEAIAAYERAIVLKPDYVEAHTNMGVVLNDVGRTAEAITAHERAIFLKPDCAEAYTNLGLALNDVGRTAEAIAAHERAIFLKPDYAKAYTNLGVVLNEAGRIEEAISAHDRALALKPHYAEAHSNRGIALLELLQYSEARKSFELSVQNDPNFVNGRVNLAFLQLLQGEFEQGWLNFEARKQKKEVITAINLTGLTLPERADMAGKKILIFWEQGLGDTIHFWRYIHLLGNMCREVVFAPQDSLINLLRPNFQDVTIKRVSDIIDDFDFKIPLMSLPHLFNTTESTIPATSPYLSADPIRVQDWRERLGQTGFKVGICWKGGSAYKRDHLRSFSLAHFERIANMDHVRLISLHKGDGEADLEKISDQFSVESLDADVDQGGAFVDTAAVMQNLDLVITSDTSIAHLAGALGVKTWIVLPYLPDWRWQAGGEDSIWYPTARLFRQTERGNWASVFRTMEDQLRKLLISRNAAGVGALGRADEG